jgi:predicted P-loop ATPase
MLSEFWDRLRLPTRGKETLNEYLGMKKGQQDDLKDVGGYVCGTLNGTRRKANNVIGRDVITLDFDNIPAGGTDDVWRRVEGLGVGYCIYSTRKHHGAAPRLRVLIPFDRTVTADEYEPLARLMAQYIALEMADPTTFEVARLMYWPSCCSDSQYFYHTGDKPFLYADGLLAEYADWRDVSLWPALPGAANFTKLAVKQGDPDAKQGVVGAFCRTYDVYRAMDELIPGIYEPVDNIPDRYTYLGGSTTGGAVLYDSGKFLFSHHATDPCSGRLVNAFDLVRLHRFADLDDEAKPNTPNNRLPSFVAMCELAVQDRSVSAQMASDDFSNMADNSQTPAASLEWVEQLTRDQNGLFHKTLNNIMLLILNAPELCGCARRDDFSNRIYTADNLPWRADKGYWSDADTTELRKHFETQYKGFKPGKQDIKDAVVAASVKQKFHPVRDYLTPLAWDGRPRLDTLFIDYLGVSDSEYTRAVTRKALVGAVARIMTPGCKFDYMLVFVGNQGRGKSSIIYKLAGGDEWFTDSLVTFYGNSAFEAVTGKWLVEVPEMHAFDKVTMNQAKAFISKQSDFYRAAYAEFPEDRRRQCAFFGTTNNTDCLRDETGGRRFWPLVTDAAERKKRIFTDLDAERDQIWAEAVFYWKMGETLYLSAELENIAAEKQEAHREAHPWEDTIRNFVDQDIPHDWDMWDLSKRMTFWGGGMTGDITLVKRTKICVREIWQEALSMNLATLDQQKSRAIAGTLNRMKEWQKAGSVRFGKLYGVQKGYTRGVTDDLENSVTGIDSVTKNVTV